MSFKTSELCNCLPVLTVSPFEKKLLTVVAITVIVVALLATSYCICGFTPLTEQYVFQSLAMLSTELLAVATLCWGAVAVGSIFALILVSRSKVDSQKDKHYGGYIVDLDNPGPREVVVDKKDSERVKALLVALPKEHTEPVWKFLEGGCTKPKELYDFYYHLASLTDVVLQRSSTDKRQWREFLNLIHGLQLIRNDTSVVVTIDCTKEFERLEGTKSELKIELLKPSDRSARKDLQRIIELHAEVTGERGVWQAKQVKDAFNDPMNQTHVVRERSSGKIIGLVMCKEMAVRGKLPKLYFHTLMRTPNAVKFGMTQLLKTYFLQLIVKEKYSQIYCTVQNDDTTARNLYLSLGFVISATQLGELFSDESDSDDEDDVAVAPPPRLTVLEYPI